jgi:Family of unknown function (DUF6152)
MMVTKLRMRAMLGAVLAGVAAHAFAHHGTAVNYDMTKTITIVGTVTEFHWRNPHSTLFLDVQDDAGAVVNYAIELPSPTLLARGELGWTRRTFKPGDHVEFKAHPSRTGAPIAVGGCTQQCEVLVNGKPPAKEY